jgi:hypothetical protein
LKLKKKLETRQNDVTQGPRGQSVIDPLSVIFTDIIIPNVVVVAVVFASLTFSAVE